MTKKEKLREKKTTERGEGQENSLANTRWEKKGERSLTAVAAQTRTQGGGRSLGQVENGCLGEEHGGMRQKKTWGKLPHTTSISDGPHLRENRKKAQKLQTIIIKDGGQREKTSIATLNSRM